MSSWFLKSQSKTETKLRLFCFPYAGGSASVFSDWHKYLPDFVELCAIQAPGRGRRFTETPISCLKTKVALVHRELIQYTDIPYIFVGHSNGALLAYELARELQNSGNCNLAHIILSAKRPPHLPEIKPQMHDLPHSEFIRKLKEYDFTPDEILKNDELMELFSPMIRADFSLSETHQHQSKPLLDASASIFWGSRDSDVPFNDVIEWNQLISGNLDLVEFNDGHFFIDSMKSKYLAEVNTIINNTMACEC